ncbi:MAG: EamA family transporter [Janthinobacterium lividum]
MLFVVLAGLSGLVWGVGDFAGGKATQRADALGVVWVSKLFSLPLLALYLVLVPTPLDVRSLWWGVLAGAFGMIGVVVFYRALSAGAMSVVAPVASVTSAVIPVVVGVAAGERPGPLALVGVTCALVAIALVSLAPPRPGVVSVVTGRLVGQAVVSGVGFALFFVFLARANVAAGGDAGLWPVASAQAAALILSAGLIIGARARAARTSPAERRPRGRALAWTAVAGPFDMSANALYLVATRYGDLSLVAPLAALYPVTTVLLALAVDRERLRPLQLGGLVLALAALLLVSGPLG